MILGRAQRKRDRKGKVLVGRPSPRGPYKKQNRGKWGLLGLRESSRERDTRAFLH